MGVSDTPMPSVLDIAILSPLVTEAKTLVALSACSVEIKLLIESVECKVWQQACAVSRQTAYAPRCITSDIASWRDFLHERTPGTSSHSVRVLGEDDLQVNEQLAWAALIAVIGPFRSGKSALVQRLVRQEAPAQSRGKNVPAVGTGIRACVLQAFGLRGRLRLFEIDERQILSFAAQLRKADAVLVLCDQAEGIEGATDALRLLSLLNIAAPPYYNHRPCFLVLSKMDVQGAHEDVHAAVRALQLGSAALLADCEVISVSAMDGAGIDLLLHLLAWRLLACGSPSREHLLQRSTLGGCKLLHRTAGAMNPNEVLRAILHRAVVEVS